MKKLSEAQIRERVLKLDKFEMVSGYSWYVCIDGTGFMYNIINNTWWRRREPYVLTYPPAFYDKIRNETVSNINSEASSIEEVLEAVSDDIRDTILFNLNLFR